MPAALTTVADMTRAGLAPAADTPALDRVAADFKIRLSAEMHRAIADPDDAIARQFVPNPAELLIRAEELADPIGDAPHSPTPGLTHRYPDRVILHATHTCEVYCRFCFRREVVGEDGPLADGDLTAALDYIAATPAIWEVILTGGDPMSLSPRRLRALLARLDAIPHVQVVRFHTRVPVVAPERITDDLIDALSIRPTVWVAIHTNHAQELTDGAEGALTRLSRAGIPMVSQTVLLKGINDSADTLAALFRALIRHRVKPYYLHHGDLARGTGHFRTSIAEGQAIMRALQGRLSGICLPTYVLDIPGGFGKAPIGPTYAVPDGDGWQITDYNGQTHRYG